MSLRFLVKIVGPKKLPPPICAWFFLRSAELRSLKGRKYLDALCVYFWATTPVLISILVFATYKVVLKKELTAAKVCQFTSG